MSPHPSARMASASCNNDYFISVFNSSSHVAVSLNTMNSHATLETTQRFLINVKLSVSGDNIDLTAAKTVQVMVL